MFGEEGRWMVRLGYAIFFVLTWAPVQILVMGFLLNTPRVHHVAFAAAAREAVGLKWGL